MYQYDYQREGATVVPDKSWIPVGMRDGLKRSALNYITKDRWFVHAGEDPQFGSVVRDYFSDMVDREATAHAQECGLVEPISETSFSIEEFEEDESTGSDYDTEKVKVLRAKGVTCRCGKTTNVATKASVDDLLRDILISSIF